MKIDFYHPHEFYSNIKKYSPQGEMAGRGIYSRKAEVEKWLTNLRLNFSLNEDYSKDRLTYIPILISDLRFFVTENYFEYLPEHILVDLRDPSSNLFILFFNTWESTGMHDLNNGIPKMFFRFKKEQGIGKDKLFWISNDLNIRHNINLFNRFSCANNEIVTLENLYIPSNKLEEKHFLGIDMFQSKLWTEEMVKMPILTKEQLKLENSKVKKKYALSKTGKVRKNRLIIADTLVENNLLDKTYFSWVDVVHFDKPNANTHSLRYTFSVFNPQDPPDGDKANKFIKNIKYIDSNKPWVLDIDPLARENFQHIGFQSNIQRGFLANSYATIVTETDFDELKIGSFFITEKTYQQFAFYHPFILVGVQGLYSYIKSKGYETFHDLFDESFDDIFDPVERMKRIKKSILNFYNTPKKKLTDIVSSDYFIDKLIHNRNNLEKIRQEEKYTELKKWLLQKGRI